MIWRVRPPRRPDRHPWQIWVTITFGVATAFQLLQGPAASSTNARLLSVVQETLACAALIGVALVILAAVLRDTYNASAIELGGMLILGAVFVTYAVTILQTNDEYWRTAGFWWAAGLTIACTHRSQQLFADLRSWQKGRP